MKKRETLNTEQQNKNSLNIDQYSVSEILETINDEDQTVATAIRQVLPDIEIVVSFAKQSLSSGGRVFYICLLYTSPSPRDGLLSRMPSSA